MAKREKRRYSDRRQYLIAAVHKRRKKIRKMAIEYKGGSCECCGYNRCIEALEFHHTNSNGKDFSISNKGYTRSWERVKKELDKLDGWMAKEMIQFFPRHMRLLFKLMPKDLNKVDSMKRYFKMQIPWGKAERSNIME